MPVVTALIERSAAPVTLSTTRSASVLARLSDLRGLGRVGLDGLGKLGHAVVERLGDRLGAGSTCSLIASMRPTHRFSNRPMTWPSARSVSPETWVMRALGSAGDLRQGALGLAAGVAERYRRGRSVGADRVGDLLGTAGELFGGAAGGARQRLRGAVGHVGEARSASAVARVTASVVVLRACAIVSLAEPWSGSSPARLRRPRV